MIAVEKDTKSSKCRMLIVDDYLGVYRTLSQLIDCEFDLKVCAVAGSVSQVLRIIENHSFDLVIVDASLDCANGLELTGVMKSRCPDMPVVILSAHGDLLYVEYALRSGISGYLVKLSDTTKEILTAIRHVLDGGNT